MCGIVGYAGRSHGVSEALLTTMREALAHRGPDAAGIWSLSDGRVVLGHRRLAILDLTPTGAQPMARANDETVIVFNGEIYNHEDLRKELRSRGAQFAGRSDTEVVLAAYREWGEDCPRQLRGMFAFAIYDARKRILFLARDRAGEKPLYWSLHRDGLVFASELKALIADDAFRPTLSAQGLAFYLSFGYVPADYCILRGTHKLMAGHSLTWSIENHRLTTRRYWDLPSSTPADSASRDDLVDELHSLLRSAIREQLVADVPVAVLLSGGIDSSLVTGIAASVADQPVRTFTISVPDTPKFDEARHARKVSKHFGTNHVELAIDASSLDLLKQLSVQFDEPISDSSMIPTYLLAKTVSRHCKVVLGGDGGDELFGGYKAYQGFVRQAEIRRKTPSVLRNAVAMAARFWLAPGTRGRNGLIGLAGSLADGVAQMGIMFDREGWGAVSPWLAEQSVETDPKTWRRALVEPERGVPGAAMAADFRLYMSEDVLTKVDRASMLCSLEVRAPLLDQRIIEFAFGRVPNRHRASVTERKILLKSLARRLLPSDLDIDRKQGFSIPLAHWLTPTIIAQWKEECREQIAAVLSVKSVSWRTRELNEGMYHRIFSLMMLTSWMREYRVAL